MTKLRLSQEQKVGLTLKIQSIEFIILTNKKEKATGSISLLRKPFYFSVTQFSASSSEKVLDTEIPSN